MNPVRFLWAATAVVLLAPPDLLPAQSRSELPPRLHPAARAAIERLADSLAHESLPTAPLFDKAAEGALKGADDARIVAAVRGLAQRLREARTLLGPNGTDAELAAGASALRAGAPPSLLRRLIETRDTRLAGRPLDVSLVVLANLVADGVPAPVALESLTALMMRGIRDEELSGFRRSVARDIEGGQAPRDAASRVTERLLHAIDARSKQP